MPGSADAARGAAEAAQEGRRDGRGGQLHGDAVVQAAALLHDQQQAPHHPHQPRCRVDPRSGLVQYVLEHISQLLLLKPAAIICPDHNITKFTKCG